MSRRLLAAVAGSWRRCRESIIVITTIITIITMNIIIATVAPFAAQAPGSRKRILTPHPRATPLPPDAPPCPARCYSACVTLPSSVLVSLCHCALQVLLKVGYNGYFPRAANVPTW